MSPLLARSSKIIRAAEGSKVFSLTEFRLCGQGTLRRRRVREKMNRLTFGTNTTAGCQNGLARQQGGL
ncbi:hypothetical protein AA14337_2312 [Acetobacter malorum DSM 14337]|uniref:Uncharacterized protein n=1 Tax=Acetobacter malorum DSM 14337 TaxID=1307910 RepID=A0ABQ0PV47_9PROT|nr:hypothetical protein AA14337_2312 [Acetobacter malorum DSM 14337]